MAAILRENAAGTVTHPDTLNLGDEPLSRVDPVAYPYLSLLTDGDPANGWEGDARLCMYQGPEARYFLLRLERDEVYRVVCRSKPFGIGMMGPEGVQKLVRELIARDTRRGVDLGAETITHNQKIDADRDQNFNDFIDEELAPRLAYNFNRSYLPGFDIQPRLR